MKLIKVKSFLLAIICILFFNCKNSEDKTENLSSENKDSLVLPSKLETNITNVNNATGEKEKLKNFQGVWYSYKFIKDKRYDESFDENYAEEVSNYSSFSIKSDSLIVPNWCKTTIYEYEYPVKTKKFEDESVFTTYFKPIADSLTFISSYNTSELSCEKPYKTIYFMNNELIIHDRGYFFFYKKGKSKLNNNNFSINGIPGDNRNAW